MAALHDYRRPFFGRAAHMMVRPLDLADVQTTTKLTPADAVDALLITGGFPEVVAAWESGMSRLDYLRDSLTNPLSPLFMAGERSLYGEFPEPGHTRTVLETIGAGERTFSAIANKAGAGNPLPSGTLSPILTNLTTKQMIVAELPLSTASDTKNKRYRVDDSYLRFWLAFLQRGIAESERGRGDLVLNRIERSWTSWRGRAVEPLVRESLTRLLPDDRWPHAEFVGGWWNRQNNPEIDLVGADRAPTANRIEFVGSIKWLDSQRFDRHDYHELVRSAAAVPGASDNPALVAVSRSGVAKDLLLAAHWGPADLIAAWRP
jgi:hypothetical protein